MLNVLTNKFRIHKNIAINCFRPSVNFDWHATFLYDKFYYWSHFMHDSGVVLTTNEHLLRAISQEIATEQM